MIQIIMMDLRMAIKTHRNRIVVLISASILFLFDTINFHFYATKAMTNTTPPMTSN